MFITKTYVEPILKSHFLKTISYKCLDWLNIGLFYFLPLRFLADN